MSRRKFLLVGAILSTCLLVSIQASQSDGGPDDGVAANEIVEAQVSVGAADGALHCGIGQPSTSIRPRIVGGVEAEPGEYPWMVNMVNVKNGSDFHFCDGVIIDERYILTAKHCVIGKNRTVEQFLSRKLLIGDYDQKNMDGEQTIGIERVIFKNATSEEISDDIALLRTNQKVEFRLTSNGLGSVNRICLPRGEDFKHQHGRLVTVAGWGRTETGKTPAKLREVDVPITECFDEQYELSRYELCADGSLKGHFKGDSGGPLIARSLSGQFVLAGIVQARQDYIIGMDGIYANVYRHLEWIDFYLKQNNTNN